MFILKKTNRACQKLGFITKFDRKEALHMVEEEEANSAKQLILLIVRPASFCIPSQMREGKKVKGSSE